MKTFYPFLCTAALLGPGAPLSFATDPVVPVTGKVLLVDERHTMEGDIELVGDQYRIRQGSGETWLPADKALRLCASQEQALAWLRSQANLDDPDEHLRLAVWCRDHNLPTEALNEVRRAVQLRPGDKATAALLSRLENDANTAASHPKPTVAAEPPAPPLAFPLSAQSMGQFISQVQPILMNSCASCHANGRTSVFRLMHATELGSRKATQQNLAAVLAQVNLNQPQASPFLTRALGVHGAMVQAPFKNNQAPAYRTLESWVVSTIASNPNLRDTLPTATVQAPSVPPGPPVFGEMRAGQPVGSEPFRTAVPSNTVPASAEVANPAQDPGGFASQTAAPVQAPLPDAFDPDEFNRANHPVGQPQPQPLPTPPVPPPAPTAPPVRPAGR